ncbi:MAG: type II secretion system protein [Bdellovibrionales bacterium]|nr:type II secretion system protein [Bdellovibrionales bacterium]
MRRARSKQAEAGFTLIELLAVIGILAVFSVGVVNYMIDVFRRVGIENKMALAAQELKNGLSLMSSELRMSRSSSPYLPGDIPENSDCSSALSISGDTIRFLVAHDDESSTTGVQLYYVGYKYVSDQNRLIRGQILAPGAGSCVLPVGDPVDVLTAQMIADDVVQIDTDGDGVLDDPFSISGDSVVINLGVEVTGPGEMTMTEELSTRIKVRAEEL